MSTRLPKPRPSVVVNREESELFLIDEERGEVWEINETAARIFALCQRAVTLDEAVAELMSGIEQAAQQALICEDIAAVVLQFEELGICQEQRPSE